MTVLFPTPVFYDGNDARYLRRDGARLIAPLQTRGDSGVKIVLSRESATIRPSSPALSAGTFSEWCQPSFWASFRAEAALCYFGFGSRRFRPVVRAMRDAGIRLSLKTDSSFGLNRFPRHAMIWAKKCYWVARERYAPPAACAKAACDMAIWACGRRASSLVPYLESFETITVESSLSLENTRDWLLRQDRKDLADRVAFVPHPVPDDFVFDPQRDKKENLVVAVAADWNNPRKRASLLGGALDRFLAGHSGWHAVVVGKNSARVAAAASCAAKRIHLRSDLEANGLLPLYRAGRIFLTASGSEAAPNVVFEALACGCSVVFPPELLNLAWISDLGRGRMSASGTALSLAAAMDSAAEADNPPFAAPPDRAVPLHAAEIVERLFPSSPAARTGA